MKKTPLILVAVIVIAALVTNPNAQEHKDAIKHFVAEKLEEETRSEDGKDDLGNLIGYGLGKLIADKVIDHMVTVDNYAVCSFTKARVKGENKVIGFGMFGKVFLFVDEQELGAYHEEIDLNL